MEQKKKINLGFDIGVASVGWSIIDEEYNILDMGVRLFDDPADPKDGTLKNETRRKSRELRRQIRRSRKRKDDFIYLALNNNLVSSEEEFYQIINKPLYLIDDNAKTILDLKVKGLNQKLTNEELLVVLFNYLSNRGIFYEIIDSEKNDEKKNNELEISKYDRNIFPSIQLKQFCDKYGWYKNAPYKTQIQNSEYVNEIKELFKIQNLNENFKEQYLKIFMRMRDYKTGPGSEHSPTPYGLWRIEKGELKHIGNNLWDYTIGKCTVYQNEIRGAKNAPIAEVFNLLNELNNLTILNNENQTKLTKKNKVDLSNLIQNNWINKQTNKNVTINEISKIVWENDNPKLHVEDYSGFRQISYDSNKKKDSNKADFQKLNNYFATVKFLLNTKTLKEEEIDILNNDFLKKVNDVFEKVRENQNPKEAAIEIKKLDSKFNNISEQEFEHYFKSLKSISASHSLSYKAMLEYIAFGIEHNENQMKYFAPIIQQNQNELFQDKKISKYVPTGLFDKEIISPTTRRAFNQTIAVLNKILKKYNKNYDLENITIELARDKNSKEEQKNITDSQNKNKEALNSISKEIDQNYKEYFEKANFETRKKLKLLKAQDNKDIYDNQFISYNDVLLNPNKYEIDHIIPFSISGDNSLNNTVITKEINNRDKGNKTPYYWLSAKGKYEEFKNWVQNNNKLSSQKKKNLTYEDDPVKNAINFINRNLVDTRYASKLVLNVLQDFFNFYKKMDSNDLYNNVKVKVLNGAMTHYARYALFNQKKERKNNYHHAIDATIMNFLGMSPSIKKNLERNFKLDKTFNEYIKKDEMNSLQLIDDETGEIFSKNELYDKSNPNARKIDLQMNEFKENDLVKYSRLLKTKKNIDLSNQTIYSFRYKNDNEGNIIDKLNLLATDKNNKDKLSKYFSKDANEKDLNNLLIYKNEYNRSLYYTLKDIYQSNLDEKNSNNPFITFMMNTWNDKYPKFVRINEHQVVRKLQIIADKKTTDNIIILKKHNNKGIMESLKPLEVRIYKNIENKLVVLLINQKVLSFKDNKMFVDENKVEFILKNQLNVIETSKYLTINNGTTLLKKDDNKLYWCIGGGISKQNKIEIKKLYESNNEGKRMQIAITTIARDFLIVEMDVLGKQYNKPLDINIFFNL